MASGAASRAASRPAVSDQRSASGRRFAASQWYAIWAASFIDGRGRVTGAVRTVAGQAVLHRGGQPGVHASALTGQQVVVRRLAQQLVPELQAARAQREDVEVDGLAGRGLDVVHAAAR